MLSLLGGHHQLIFT